MGVNKRDYQATFDTWIGIITHFGTGQERNATLKHLKMLGTAGLIPRPNRNSQVTMLRWARTLPLEHREPTLRLWREYLGWCKDAMRRYEADKQQRALKPTQRYSSGA